MRELKFRAWDKEIKRMTNDVYFHEFTNINDQFQDDELEFMQFTGLKDKNGVQIYDGDIIKSNSQKPAIFKIEFIEGGFCATQNDHDCPIDINHFYPSNGCMIEVIGNIYDTPHLLQDDRKA